MVDIVRDRRWVIIHRRVEFRMTREECETIVNARLSKSTRAGVSAVESDFEIRPAVGYILKRDGCPVGLFEDAQTAESVRKRCAEAHYETIFLPVLMRAGYRGAADNGKGAPDHVPMKEEDIQIHLEQSEKETKRLADEVGIPLDATNFRELLAARIGAMRAEPAGVTEEGLRAQVGKTLGDVAKAHAHRLWTVDLVAPPVDEHEAASPSSPSV